MSSSQLCLKVAFFPSKSQRSLFPAPSGAATTVPCPGRWRWPGSARGRGQSLPLQQNQDIQDDGTRQLRGEANSTNHLPLESRLGVKLESHGVSPHPPSLSHDRLFQPRWAQPSRGPRKDGGRFRKLQSRPRGSVEWAGPSSAARASMKTAAFSQAAFSFTFVRQDSRARRADTR